MDELSALPPEVSWKRSTRVRTSSMNSRQTSTRAESPNRSNANNVNVNTDV